MDLRRLFAGGVVPITVPGSVANTASAMGFTPHSYAVVSPNAGILVNRPVLARGSVNSSSFLADLAVGFSTRRTRSSVVFTTKPDWPVACYNAVTWIQSRPQQPAACEHDSSRSTCSPTILRTRQRPDTKSIANSIRSIGMPKRKMASLSPLIEKPWTDFSQGMLQVTDKPLDIALNGKGFFGVNGPSGPLYTRNGAFHVSSSGDVVTAEGYPVRLAGGTTLAIAIE